MGPIHPFWCDRRPLHQPVEDVRHTHAWNNFEIDQGSTSGESSGVAIMRRNLIMALLTKQCEASKLNIDKAEFRVELFRFLTMPHNALWPYEAL